MKKDTDLERVKNIANCMLCLEIQTTKLSPTVVQHPFTNTGLVGVKVGEEYKVLDITKSKEDEMLWKKQVEKEIEDSDSVYNIFLLCNKPYRLLLLKYVKDYLSNSDFSVLLADCWIASENPNCDVNVRKGTLVEMFSKANPSDMMISKEKEQYIRLDDSVTIYRGVTSYNDKDLRVLSWTLDYNKAKWFANRFNENGKVYEAQIDKAHIFAFFNRRGESEVVVNPKYLMGITELEEPINELVPKM